MNPLELLTIHERLGASFEEESHGRIVGDYGDRPAEIRALKDEGALRDRSDRSVIRVEGRDRVRFLNGMLTNDVKSVRPGNACHALLLTVQGRVIGDLWLYGLDDAFWMILDPESREPVLSTLDRYLIADKVRFEDCSATMGTLSLIGPRSETMLEQALGVTSSSGDSPGRGDADSGTAVGIVPTNTVEIDGHPVMIAFTDRFGVGGADILAPRSALEGLWERLREAGARPTGSWAEETFRIECGIPRVGRELGERSIAVEGGPYIESRAISHEKGCYVGQEVVCRVVQRGRINLILSAFRIRDSAAIDLPAPLIHGGKSMGRLTSRADSPEYGRIGLGFVHRSLRAPGLVMRIGDTEHEVEVVTRAFEPGSHAVPPVDA